MFRNFRVRMIFTVAWLLRVPIVVHQSFFMTSVDKEMRASAESAAV